MINTTNSEDTSVKKFYPTVEEIVKEAPITRCDECGRQFQNSSACRFHKIKGHGKTETFSDNEERILKKNADKQRCTMAFHCPDSSCSSKKAWFDGMRNLRQHYFRSHAEKKFSCEMCGYKTALEKDINYHRKARCSVVKKQKATEEIGKELLKKRDGEKLESGRNKRKTRKESEEFERESSKTCPSSSTSTTLLQPIYFVVSPDNVHSVIETIQKSFNNSEPCIESMSAEVATQAHIPFAEDSQMSKFSFSAQLDQEPVTFCERGTMMQEPLSYFSPPYGAEFGDLTPRQKDQPFDFSVPSTSQPQTRNFGTMFENVTTCNTGTSMIDESSYVSEFLRDIETQTPNFMIQRPPDDGTTDDWMSPWRRNI